MKETEKMVKDLETILVKKDLTADDRAALRTIAGRMSGLLAEAEEKRSTAVGTFTNQSEIVKAMKETRSITLNGAGAINTVKELFTKLGIKNQIIGLVRPFYGENAQTNITILSPSLVQPIMWKAHRP
jgi:hypothetical protein